MSGVTLNFSCCIVLASVKLSITELKPNRNMKQCHDITNIIVMSNLKPKVKEGKESNYMCCILY